MAAPSSAPDKPRFDFYKILPGADEAKESKRPPIGTRSTSSPERPQDKAAPPSQSGDAAAPSGDRFWLQAGAFASPSDAENMKARLALSGWEAVVQSVSLPDKSQRYRVRLGPLRQYR